MFIFHVIFENTVTGEEYLKEVVAKDRMEAFELACEDLPSVYGDGSVYLAGPAFRKTIGA